MSALIVNGLPFSGDPYIGPGFYFRELVGWFSLSESKSEVRERKQAHGAFGIANDYRASAAISFHGFYVAADRPGSVAAKNTLKRALGVNRPVAATFDDEMATSRVVSVRGIDLADDHGRSFFEFDVDMLATDPLAYGETVTVTTGPAVSGGGLVWPLGSSGV